MFSFEYRQRRTNYVKRSNYWNRIKRSWSSSWKSCQFHIPGTCLPTRQLIMRGPTRCRFSPTTVWFLCGSIYLHLPVILLVIMSSGPLQLNIYIYICRIIHECRSPYTLHLLCFFSLFLASNKLPRVNRNRYRVRWNLFASQIVIFCRETSL